jgi:hypothetical protein
LLLFISATLSTSSGQYVWLRYYRPFDQVVHVDSQLMAYRVIDVNHRRVDAKPRPWLHL